MAGQKKTPPVQIPRGTPVEKRANTILAPIVRPKPSPTPGGDKKAGNTITTPTPKPKGK